MRRSQMRKLMIFAVSLCILIAINVVSAQQWSGPRFDARLGDPYSQGWASSDCKHVQYDETGAVVQNGADQIQEFGCYDGNPVLSPEFMSLKKAYGIDILHVDYRIYSLPTWQSLTSCADVTTMNSQMKTEARAHHNYRQAFVAPLDDADNEWVGYTVVWMARVEDLPGSIGMRVKAAAGAIAGQEVTESILSGFEARYGCVDPDNDIFGPDNLVVRSGPDPATGHDYVTQFPDEDGSDMWHIYRVAVEVGASPEESFCRIYLDENPDPVITTSGSRSDRGKPGNYLWWGVGGWNCPKVASMAYLLSTTEGAFGPDELPIPEDFQQIFQTARSFQMAEFAHPENWEGPLYDARYGDPYSQGWAPSDCKSQVLDLATGEWQANGADSVKAFGCDYVGHPALSPEFMSVMKEDSIDVLHVDYRVYTLPTWQSLTSCADVTTMNSQMKTEARAHHNYRQSFIMPLDDADNEWEGYTVTWMAKVAKIPGSIGMRVKAAAGALAGEAVTQSVLSGFEARYGCVDPDNDIFGPDNLVVRSGPDPATGHDYVTQFAEDNGSEEWHIYRIAVEVGATPEESFCRVYLDENPEPVITTSGSRSDRGKPGNYLWWGVGGWNCPKVASMAWILSTTTGAYGPDEQPIPDDYMAIFTKAKENYVSSVRYPVHQLSDKVPSSFTLEQNYPNPFNPTTAIVYQLKQPTRVVLSIFNTNGQLVTQLVNAKQEAGAYRVEWDGTDLYGNKMSSGTYLYMLKTPEFQETKKMTLLK